MANVHVPSATSLKDIYQEDGIPFQVKRWEGLLSEFKEHYGRSPDFVSRSPGRVNLIGEHIDYSQYQVLPMAVEVDVLLAVAVHPVLPGSPSKIRIANRDSDKFPTREFEIPLEGD